MKSNGCVVCGGTDLNLVDGFYYCVECGTQDQNIQERVVETVVLTDGTHAKYTTKKICKEKSDGVEMSEEWYKWHAYNFILAGLTDELIAAGAKPSVRHKVLWIWTRYIKKYQVKQTELLGEFFTTKHKENSDKDYQYFSKHNNDKSNAHLNEEKSHCHVSFEDEEKNIHFESTQYEKQNNSGNRNSSRGNIIEDDDDDEFLLDSDEEVCISDDEIIVDEEEISLKNRNRYRIHPLRKGVIIAIFYIALNLDRSKFHLSHLKRLIKSGQINFKNCTKYVPEDLDEKKIPYFLRFKNSLWNEYSTTHICTIVNSLYNDLDLGLPLIPDIRKIIDDFMIELCLPKDFKYLIESLINRYPCRYFKVSQQIREFSFVADFETVCMAYVVIALKMCFGLDSDYEIKLTDTVDKINEENNYPKAFNINSYAENTERLFSFKEWCAYLQTRKMVVCKNNFFMDHYCQTEIADDYVFLEHLQERNKRKMTLGQEISMEIINKIPLEDTVSVIPKDEFNLIHMPLTSAANVILEYIQDPDIRLVLSEDFTQYNIDYVTKNLCLSEVDKENLIKGVTLDNKIKNPIHSKHVTSFHKTSRESENVNVFVKFCDNEEYKLLKSENAIESEEKCNNKELTGAETGCDDDNISECDKETSEITFSNERTIKFVDYQNACIYDDDDKTDLKQVIDDTSANYEKEPSISSYENEFPQEPANITEITNVPQPHDLPPNFDRKSIIEELLNIASQKYNIKPVRPRKYTKPLERKKPQSVPKKKKKEHTTTYNLLSLYYKNIEKGAKNATTNNESIGNANDISNGIPNDISIDDRIDNISPPEENTEQNSAIHDSEIKLLENDDIDKELSDESDDDYVLPPIISDSDILNGQSIAEVNKAIKNILSRETRDCHEPPHKKAKKDKSKLLIGSGENLFPNAQDIKEFPYWLVWFNNMGPRANHVPFNKNLYHSFPNSFTFVLHQCAMIIDSCPFLIYRTMYHVEKLIANDVGNKINLRLE